VAASLHMSNSDSSSNHDSGIDRRSETRFVTLAGPRFRRHKAQRTTKPTTPRTTPHTRHTPGSAVSPLGGRTGSGL
jgi:hypothetical protein